MHRNKWVISDVLLINGCDPKLIPQYYQYRVLNQIEQLNAGYLNNSEVFYLNLNPLTVSDFRVIIFIRCRWTKEVDEAITFARKLNKKVLFDIDDLIIDTKYTNSKSYVHSLSQSEKKFVW